MYEQFPETVKDRATAALTSAAEGGKADIAKPLKGLGRASLLDGELRVTIRIDAKQGDDVAIAT